MNPGDIVEHKGYGIGTVISEWGVFYTCRRCYAEVPQPKNLTDFTKCCNDRPLQISGEGIYNIIFSDDKTHSINQIWLKRVPIKLVERDTNEN